MGIRQLRKLIFDYTGQKTPEGLKVIVEALLDEVNNDLLFALARNNNLAVRLAVAEALVWTREPLNGGERHDVLCVNGFYAPLFAKYADDYGDGETTADVARALVELSVAQPERFDEIAAFVRAYEKSCGLYEFRGDEKKILQPFLEDVEPAPIEQPRFDGPAPLDVHPPAVEG